jgi:hypothetical protein
LKAVEVQNTKDTIADLEGQIELLSKGDADRLTFVTLHRQLREQQSKLATKEAELSTREASVQSLKTRQTEEDREAAVNKVVTEFEVKPEVLRAFAKNHNLTTEEALRTEATQYWPPKAKEEAPPLTVISGASSGNGVDLSKLSPAEKIEKGLELARSKK